MRRLFYCLLVCHLPVLAQELDFEVVRVASGITRALYATTPPDQSDHLYIVEQNGVVRVFDQASGVLLDQPFLTLDVARFANEQGLLGLAFSPDYPQNGVVFVCYTKPTNGATALGRFVRSAEDPLRVDPDSFVEITAFDQPFGNHNGGWIGFGPDNMLYLSLGDGGSAGDPGNRSQNTSDPLGSMLRLDVSLNETPWFATPQDNPFANGGGHPLIWSYGLRNVWRASFDRLTGDFYMADVGQNAFEEVNFQPANSTGGENYGWRIKEGTSCFRAATCDQNGLTDPIYAYDHGTSTTSGRSVTGGYVYRGPIPSLQGHFFFADFVSDRIWSFKYIDQQIQEFSDWTDTLQPDQGSLRQIASFGEDARGNLFIITLNGNVFQFKSTLPELSITGPTEGYTGEQLQFSASDGFASYAWDMGGFTDEVLTTQTVEYSYPSPGTYTIRLIAQTEAGQQVEVTHQVIISNFQPEDSLRNLETQSLSENSAHIRWRGGAGSINLDFFQVTLSSANQTASMRTHNSELTLNGLTPGGVYNISIQPHYINGAFALPLSGTFTMPDQESYVLRFPHVAQNDQWWTGLTIVNSNAEAAQIELRAITQNQSIQLTNQLTSLQPGQKSVGLADLYIDPALLPDTAWIELVSSQPLAAFELFGQNFDNMSGMAVNGVLRQFGILPMAQRDPQNYVGISLINGSPEPTDIILNGFGENGSLLAQATLTALPLEKKVGVVETLFGSNWNENISSVTWESDQGVTGFEIWGDLAWRHQSGLTVSGSGALRGVIPLVESNSQIIMLNQAAVSTDILLIARSYQGFETQYTNRLSPNEKLTITPSDFAEPDFSGVISWQASGPITGLAVIERVRSQNDILREAIPGQASGSSRIIFPHIASSTQWATELAIATLDGAAHPLTLNGYDGNGVLIQSISTTLSGRLHDTAANLFQDPTTIAWVTAETEQPVLLGQLIYYTRPGNGSILGGAGATQTGISPFPVNPNP